MIAIPPCLYHVLCQPLQSARLVGFCNASIKVYAAVVYLKLDSEVCVDVKFLTANTQVTAVGGMTIPYLELL